MTKLAVTTNLLLEKAQRALENGYPKQKWVEFCEALIDKHKLVLCDSNTTVSKYVYVHGNGRPPFKVRFSNHKPNKTQEKIADCDFYVGVTHYGVTTTRDALKAVSDYFGYKKGELILMAAPQPTQKSAAQAKPEAAPKVVKPSSTLVLPTQKSRPSDKVSDYKWFIYGGIGIGKTTLANNFPKPLILDFEGRTKHLECYSIPIGCWNDVRAVYDLLSKGEHDYQTVVFDTADLLYRLCVADVCNKRKIEHPSDEAWGKGSDMVKNAIYPMITAFQALGLCIVFTSHMQEKEIKTRIAAYNKISPSLAGSPASIFLSLCDIVGYCHFDEETQEKRVITFRGSDYLEAKKSTNESVQLPDQCDLDFNVIKSYFKGESADATAS